MMASSEAVSLTAHKVPVRHGELQRRPSHARVQKPKDEPVLRQGWSSSGVALSDDFTMRKARCPCRNKINRHDLSVLQTGTIDMMTLHEEAEVMLKPCPSQQVMLHGRGTGGKAVGHGPDCMAARTQACGRGWPDSRTSGRKTTIGLSTS